MTRDDIIRMARKANLHERTKVVGGYIVNIPNLENLERFANLVAAAEREACAKVCEDRSAALEKSDNEISTVEFIEASEARRCAAAIRARGE